MTVALNILRTPRGIVAMQHDKKTIAMLLKLNQNKVYHGEGKYVWYAFPKTIRILADGRVIVRITSVNNSEHVSAGLVAELIPETLEVKDVDTYAT
jgi:hypothetical protein